MSGYMQGTALLFVVLDAMLIIFCIIVIVSPRTVWEWGDSWRYRNSAAMEPSRRRYRMSRAAGAAQLCLYVPPLVGILWPAEPITQLYVGAITAGICVVLVLTALVIASEVGKRRRAAAAVAEDVPISELSEAGYAVGWAQVGYALVYVIVITLIVLGAAATIKPSPPAPQVEPEVPATVEQQRRDRFAPSVVHEYPTMYSTRPDGLIVADAAAYQRDFDDENVMYLTQAATGCVADGVVLVETPDAIAVAIVYEQPTEPAIGMTVEEGCAIDPEAASEVFVVELESPLGKRTVTSLDGARLPKE